MSGLTKKQQQRVSDHDMNMADKTLASNLELSEYAYSKDTEAWNRQNQYNLPSAQQQRFKDAGLNPNLIYGQGSAGNASQMPDYSAPTADYSRVRSDVAGNDAAYQAINQGMAMMDQYMNTKTKAAAIDNMELRTTAQRMNFVQERNLKGYDPSQAQSDRYDTFITTKGQVGELTDYNQRLVDQQYQQLQSTKNAAIIANLDAQLKRKDITHYEYNQILKGLGMASKFK